MKNEKEIKILEGVLEKDFLWDGKVVNNTSYSMLCVAVAAKASILGRDFYAAGSRIKCNINEAIEGCWSLPRYYRIFVGIDLSTEEAQTKRRELAEKLLKMYKEEA